MSLGGIGKWQAISGFDCQTAASDAIEQIGSAGAQFLLRFNVIEKHRPAGRERAVLGKIRELEIGDYAGGLAKIHEHAALAQAFQRSPPCVGANTVIDDRTELAPGDFVDLGHEILVAIEDGVSIAGASGQCRLFRRSDRADGGCTNGSEPLSENEADTAGGRMHQNGVARLHRIGGIHQKMHCQALEQTTGSLFVGNDIRQYDEAIGLDQPVFGVSTVATDIGDAIARLHIAHAFAHRFHHARGFSAGGERLRRPGIEAAAEIDVDEIDADGGMTQQHLAGAGLSHRHLAPLHGIGVARCVENNSFHFTAPRIPDRREPAWQSPDGWSGRQGR